MTQRVILFGARSPLVPEYEEACAALVTEVIAIVRVDDRPSRSLDRRRLIEIEDLDANQIGAAFVACAFSPYRRSELVTLALDKRLESAAPLVHPSAVIARSTRVGNGSFINAGVVIGAASLVGDHVVINRSANIGHHTIIGDGSSIGPGVTIAGGVRLGEHSFVGAGSVVIPGVTIGDGAAVAAGAVVKADVEANSLVAGSPAILRRRKPSAELFAGEGEE